MGTDYFSSGISKLKTASLLLIIGTLLSGIASMMAMMSAPSNIATSALGLIGAIIALIGIFKLIPASSDLKAHDASRYGTASTLIKVGLLIGYILLLIGFLVIAAGAATLSLGLIIIGGMITLVSLIFLLIGYIGVLLLLFKLKEETNEGLFLAAAILMIIGVFIGILMFIGWILVFIACGKVLKSGISRPQAQPLAPPPPPPSA